jgi:hypothetical protein
MPLAHEGFAGVASSILLLRAGDCFEGFYTARVRSRREAFIGIIDEGDVAPLLVDALRRLKYHGHDSAGIAMLVEGKIERRRAEGYPGH